jgi:hypothetical protein
MVGSRRGHPLSRNGGYMEELATLTGLLLSAPERIYHNLKSEIADAFNYWTSGCEICTAKKYGFLFLMHKYRDRWEAQKAWQEYIHIQYMSVRRWHPGNTGRIYYREVISAMELWGNDAYVISPSGEILQIEKTFKKTILIQSPELFGFSREQLEKIYARYNENYLMEASAWAEVKNNLMAEGWVFVSFDPNKYMLTIVAESEKNEIKKSLLSFAEYVLDEKVYREEISVWINNKEKNVKNIAL